MYTELLKYYLRLKSYYQIVGAIDKNQKMIRKSIRSKNDQKQLPGTGSLTANVSHWQRSRSSWLRAPEVTALTASSVSMIIRDLNQKKFYSVTLRDR